MSLTILTADELQNLEMRAANQLGADTLMKRAGAAAAELIMKRLEDAGVEQRRVNCSSVRATTAATPLPAPASSVRRAPS